MGTALRTPAHLQVSFPTTGQRFTIMKVAYFQVYKVLPLFLACSNALPQGNIAISRNTTVVDEARNIVPPNACLVDQENWLKAADCKNWLSTLYQDLDQQTRADMSLSWQETPPLWLQKLNTHMLQKQLPSSAMPSTDGPFSLLNPVIKDVVTSLADKDENHGWYRNGSCVNDVKPIGGCCNCCELCCSFRHKGWGVNLPCCLPACDREPVQIGWPDKGNSEIGMHDGP